MKNKTLIAVFLLAWSLTLGLTFSALKASSQASPPNLRSGDPLPENLFVELAKLINPAVVSVAVSIHQQGTGYRDPFLDLLEQFMNQGQPQQPPPQQREAQGIGTGFIIESDGLAVTNNHVIQMADEIKVQFSNRPDKLYPAKVIGRDPRTDIALIKIEADFKLPTVKMGVSKDVQVGEWVAAFGNPYGHTFSVTKGIVSALGRQIRELNALPFIQTDASINPGNSGGPLVNTHGEVIGVNSAIDARAQGIGFAIPIDYVKEMIPELKKNGKITRGYLGVSIDEVTPRAQQALKIPTGEGALIMDVLQGSPADRGGLKPYDVVVEFGGTKVKDPQDLIDDVADTKIGETKKVIVYRSGKKLTLNLKVTEPPPENTPKTSYRNRQLEKQGQPAPHNLGFKVVDYSPKVAKDLNLSSQAPRKPVIVSVEPNSPAAGSGLRPRDQILDVNREAVNTAADVNRLLQPGSNMMRVYNSGQVSIVFLSIE